MKEEMKVEVMERGRRMKAILIMYDNKDLLLLQS